MGDRTNAPNFYNEYLWWEQYNAGLNGVPSTHNQIDAHYGRNNFALPPVVNPPVAQAVQDIGGPVRNVSARRQSVQRAPADAVEAATRASYLQRPVGVTHGHGGPAWTGVKFLGRGAAGSVCLWEYTGNPASRPAAPHDKVVIKMAHYAQLGFTRERDVLRDLGRARSNHIVKMLSKSAPMKQKHVTAQQLGNEWLGQVRRIALEYCPSGSLYDLYFLRLERNVRLEELTLWKIFDCLVDGCAVLEHQKEFTFNANGNAQILNSIENSPDDPGVIVHFDLKPSNILTLRNEAVHRDTPLCKIADFGWSLYRYRNMNSVRPHTMWTLNEEVRRRGTNFYKAPEQFTPRWNYADYRQSPVCGKYGTKTNVWGIGQIILACYNMNPVNPVIPFIPGPIRGDPPRGRVFGTEIQSAPNLSQDLRDTIHECLYETPSDRPTLQDLKDRCRTNIDALEAGRVLPEGWQDLEYLEPLTNAESVSPRFRLVKKRCTALKAKRRARCGIKRDFRANNTLPRCEYHWDLREFPPR